MFTVDLNYYQEKLEPLACASRRKPLKHLVTPGAAIVEGKAFGLSMLW